MDRTLSDLFFEGDPARNYKKRGMVSSVELIRNVNLCEAPGQPRTTTNFDICLESL